MILLELSSNNWTDIIICKSPTENHRLCQSLIYFWPTEISTCGYKESYLLFIEQSSLLETGQASHMSN